jgi:hypothetical protein
MQPPLTTETHSFLSIYEKMTTEGNADQFQLACLLERLPNRSTCDYLYAVFVLRASPNPIFSLPNL